MSRRPYLPILLTKRGELSAVADLTADVRQQLTPLFVVHPIDVDFETGLPSKSVAEHVGGLGVKIARTWGTGRAFIDPAFVIDLHSDQTGGLRTLVDDARQAGLQLVPVVAPDRPPAYLAAATDLHERDQAGVCVRLSPKYWPTTLAAVRELDSLLDAVRVSPGEVDLVLDLRDEVRSQLSSAIARTAVLGLPYAASWRSVTLAAAAFPRDLAGLPKNSISRIPRLDWQLYREIAAEVAAAGQRVPNFGDYAIAHPDPTLPVNPRYMNISGSLRYTSDNEWLVAKGGVLFKGRGGGAGGEAIRPAAILLARTNEYCGPDFPAGDGWIDQVARHKTSCGNPERWRRTATNQPSRVRHRSDRHPVRVLSLDRTTI
jgi:hypothetical protein